MLDFYLQFQGLLDVLQVPQTHHPISPLFLIFVNDVIIHPGTHAWSLKSKVWGGILPSCFYSLPGMPIFKDSAQMPLLWRLFLCLLIPKQLLTSSSLLLFLYSIYAYIISISLLDNKPLSVRDPSFSGSQLGTVLLPRGNLAMSGHIFGSCDWDGVLLALPSAGRSQECC